MNAVLVGMAILCVNFVPWLVGAVGLTLLSRSRLARRWGVRLHERWPSRAQMIDEARVSVVSLLVYALVQWAAVMLAMRGFGALRLAWDDETPRFLVVTTPLVYLALDAWWFWTHRLMHVPRIFKHVHARHHGFTNPSPFASYAQSIPESLVNAAPYLIFPMLLPSHVVGWAVVHALLTVFASIGHCGVELFQDRGVGKMLVRVFNNATHHGQHHVNARVNFGSMTTLWDRICRTNHPFWLHAALPRRLGRGDVGPIRELTTERTT